MTEVTTETTATEEPVAVTETTVTAAPRAARNVSPTIKPQATVAEAKKEAASKQPTQALLEAELDSYLAKMAPNTPITDAEGVAQQLRLKRIIDWIMSLDNAEFTPAFRYLLSTIRKNIDGAFAMTHIFRFFDRLTMPSNERRSFERVLEFLRTVAIPSQRTDFLKHVNLADVFRAYEAKGAAGRVEDALKA